MPITDATAKKIRFDGTINLGHVLTAISFLGMGMVAWSQMDKRVVVLEEARLMQAQLDKRQDEDRNEIKRSIREDIKDVNNKLDRLLDRKR